MSIKKKIVLIVVIVTVGGIALFAFHFSCGITEYYSESWASKSMNQSKENGVFVKTVRVIPRNLFWHGEEIKFREVWIEKRSKINYQFFLFKERILFDDYRLVFTLDSLKTLEVFDLLFIDGDKGNSFANQGSGDNWIFMKHINDIIPDTIKVSLVENFKEKRKKNIYFIPNNKY